MICLTFMFIMIYMSIGILGTLILRYILAVQIPNKLIYLLA